MYPHVSVESRGAQRLQHGLAHPDHMRSCRVQAAAMLQVKVPEGSLAEAAQHTDQRAQPAKSVSFRGASAEMGRGSPSAQPAPTTNGHAHLNGASGTATVSVKVASEPKAGANAGGGSDSDSSSGLGTPIESSSEEDEGSEPLKGLQGKAGCMSEE